MKEFKNFIGSIEETQIKDFLDKCDDRTRDYNDIQYCIKKGTPDLTAINRFIAKVSEEDYEISYYGRALALMALMVIMDEEAEYSEEDQKAMSDYTHQVEEAGERMKYYLEEVQKAKEALK